MTTQMIVRADPDLEAKVNNCAKAEGKSVSEVVGKCSRILSEIVQTKSMMEVIKCL